MPAPQAVLCHLCGGKYFKHSLSIHLKQCEKKYVATHSRCQYCGTNVANDDWGDHRQHCKPQIVGSSKSKNKRIKNFSSKVELPQSVDNQLIPTVSNKSQVIECQECETESAMWKCIECEQHLCIMCETELHRKGARSKHQRIPLTVNAFEKSNVNQMNDSNDNNNNENDKFEEMNDLDCEMKDPRRECKFCQRKFNPDRIEKHMRICNVHTKKSKKRKEWNGSEHRVNGTVFEEFKYHRSRTPPQILEWRKNGRRWRKERDEFRQIIEIGKEIESQNNEKKQDTDIEISAPSYRAPPSQQPRAQSRPSQQRHRKSKTLPSVQGKSATSSSAVSKKIDNKIATSHARIHNKDEFTIGTVNGMNDRNNKIGKNRSRDGTLRNSRVNSDSSSPVSLVRSNSGASSVNGNLRNSLSIRKKNDDSKMNSKERKPRIPKSGRIAGKRTGNDDKKKSKYSIKTSNDNETDSLTNEMKQLSVSEEIEIFDKNENKLLSSNVRIVNGNKKLTRGEELGWNVDNQFDSKPKNMQDYRERERIRRQKAKLSGNGRRVVSNNNSSSEVSSNSVSSFNNNNNNNNKNGSNVNGNSKTGKRNSRHSIRKAGKELAFGPGGKRMPRVEIQKQINFQEKAIGKTEKGKDKKELSEQRAAYFESLLQHQQ